MTERINISVPDELADRARQSQLSISKVCQEALRAALDGEPMAQDVDVSALAQVIAEAIRSGGRHECHWTIIDVTYPERPRTVHPRMATDPNATYVLMKCDICNVVAVDELTGRWSKEQLMGSEPGPTRT